MFANGGKLIFSEFNDAAKVFHKRNFKDVHKVVETSVIWDIICWKISFESFSEVGESLSSKEIFAVNSQIAASFETKFKLASDLAVTSDNWNFLIDSESKRRSAHLDHYLGPSGGDECKSAWQCSRRENLSRHTTGADAIQHNNSVSPLTKFGDGTWHKINLLSN